MCLIFLLRPPIFFHCGNRFNGAKTLIFYCYSEVVIDLDIQIISSRPRVVKARRAQVYLISGKGDWKWLLGVT